MAELKFKVGDQVVVNSRAQDPSRPGDTGRVREVDTAQTDDELAYLVEFDYADLWCFGFELDLVEARRNCVPARALRFNSGKPELHYADLMPAALAGLSLSFTYGCQRAEKPYPPYNWCKPASWTELYSAARRHMCKALNGEDFDPDAVAQGFQLHHLDSAIGNLCRLRQQIADGIIVDDRSPEALAKSKAGQ